jgi:hypothetical protein
MAIKHWPALVVTWMRCSADQLLGQLHELVNLLSVSLDKLRADRSCPRNFGIRGARPPRRAYH